MGGLEYREVRTSALYHIGRSVGIFLPSAYGPYY